MVWLRRLFFALFGCVWLLTWGQWGCAPKDPCLSCKSNELCKNNVCVPLSPIPDGGVKDEIGQDSPVVFDAKTYDVGTAEQRLPTDSNNQECSASVSCSQGYTCTNGICKQDKTEPTPNQEPPATTDGGVEQNHESVTNKDAGPIDQPPADRAIPDSLPPEPKPQCTKDDDCANTHLCKSNKCVRKPPTCSPACEAGAKCLKGICEKPGTTPGLSELCGLQSKCKAGLHCLKTDRSHSHCFQKCKTNGECKNNPFGKICIQMTQTDKFCVDIVQDGALCGFKSKLQALCSSGSICSEGICKKSKEVKVYEQCGVNAQVCSTKMICLRFGGKTSGYCVLPCTPGGASCAGNGTCLKLSGGSGACLPAGTGQHDDICGGEQTGPKLNAKLFCKTGLECVQLGKAICMEFWTGDCKTPGKTCPSGRACQELKGGSQSFGACFSRCSGGSCGKTHLECRKQFKNTCWPK